MTHGVRQIAFATLASALIAAAASAAEIAVRGEAEVAGGVVTLADIAEISGADAERLGGLVIAEFPETQARSEIDLAQVRDTLSAAGVNWALHLLRGPATVSLRRPPTPRAVAAEASGPAANPRGALSVDDAAPARGRTLRDLLVEHVRMHHGGAGDDLRIEFDERDERTLETPAGSARFELRPGTSDMLGRVPYTITRHVNGRPAGTDRVTLQVSARRSAAVLTRNVRPGQTITPSDLEVREVWLDAPAVPVTDAEQVIGHRATGLMRSGTVIEQEDVRPPIVVNRRQQIWVSCVTGSLVVRIRARALSEGAIGDVIEVRNERSREQMFATVTGPGQAVMLSGEDAGLAALEGAG